MAVRWPPLQRLIDGLTGAAQGPLKTADESWPPVHQRPARAPTANARLSAELPNRVCRWTASELAVVFAYLESKPQTGWSSDDWALLVDWWLQRWLPADMTPQTVRWKELKSSLGARIQSALAKLAKQSRGQRSELPIVRSPPQRQPTESYVMAFAEFEQVIMPLLGRYPFAAGDYDDADVQRLYELTDPRCPRPDNFWDASYLACDLRYNYEQLRGGALVNENVSVGVHRNCTCLRLFHRCEEDAGVLLNAYSAERSPMPLLPPPETPCAHLSDSRRLCSIWVTRIARVTTSGDADFDTQVDLILRGGPPKRIPKDWQRQLTVIRN
jgi:hypothetical protein